jgi:solute carrier family 6 amino acid transporter-like protein 5/7/9/14
MGIGDTLLKSTPSETKEPEDINPNQTDPKRIQWDNQTEFLLTCIGYSVGLGNVWRFPYLCYKSGGGAFLLPYLIMIFLIGMPLLFMEYGFGQYFGIGSLSIYKKVCPMFQGIGIGYTVLNALVCVYYNVIIALSIYYLVASFAKNLPWAHCGNSWNTETCSAAFRQNDTYSNDTFGNSSLDYDFYNGTSTPVWSTDFNETTMNVTHHMKATSPSDEYFRLAVMGMGDEHNISNIGQIRWKLCIALIIAWVLVVIFVSRGIKSTGKVAYFTATFPYVMLTVLVVRGVTLPGASKGILYFIKPQFDKLAKPEVWFGAATQLFYSTNLAWGGMITMSSYSSFHHNMFRDAILINWVSFFTSIYAGFAVFSIIGYMSEESGQAVEDIIESGPGLAFIVYPRALSLMPLPQLWSVLFFFMLFLLGVGSQMVDLETIMTAIMDKAPHLRKHRFLVLTIVAVFLFFCGLPQTTQGGMYVLQLMDWYAAGFCVIVIAIFECTVISWIYGSHTEPSWVKKVIKTDTKFSYNIKEMLETGLPNIWWRICWKFISPFLLIGILIFSFVDYQPAKYGDYRYPLWADCVGWVMSLASVVPIFAVAIYKFIKAKGNTWSEKLFNCTNVTDAPKPGIEQSTLDMKNYSVDLYPDDDVDGKTQQLMNSAGDTNML